MNDKIITYLRNKKGSPIGAIVAVAPFEKSFGIGWSKLNVSAGDVWDRTRAIHIAEQRAINGFSPNIEVPHDVTREMDRMQDRARRYFKGKSLLA
jgi:hypothetical protein